MSSTTKKTVPQSSAMPKPDFSYHLLLTFDYELFLGSRSGTPLKCLIEPTQSLLSVLDKHNARSVFFVDALYLKKLLDQGLEKDYNMVADQIRRIKANGHDVFLHIHPHWLDAVYDAKIGEWDLSNIRKYAFSALNDDEVEQIFSQGYETMNDILGIEGKVITGYRAGGLFVQPFPRLSTILQKLNITNEFSVFPGFKSDAGGFSIQFPEQGLPLAYSFSSDILKPEANGLFKEYTINKFSFSTYNRWINSIVFRVLMRQPEWKPYGNGKGATHIIENNHKRIGLFDAVTESYSVELMNPWKCRLYEHDLRSKRYLHFLSHPKLISKGNINCLDSFLNAVSRFAEVNYDFRNIPLPFIPTSDSAV